MPTDRLTGLGVISGVVFLIGGGLYEIVLALSLWHVIPDNILQSLWWVILLIVLAIGAGLVGWMSHLDNPSKNS